MDCSFVIDYFNVDLILEKYTGLIQKNQNHRKSRQQYIETIQKGWRGEQRSYSDGGDEMAVWNRF
jgi:hypothetical protein